jgi:two-component system OmpR family response regulator
VTGTEARTPNASPQARPAIKLLLLEDDAHTADYVARGLRELGHTLDVCADGREAVFLATDGSYDVLIVDRMVPNLDGLSVIRMLRAGGVATPALVLTAVGGVKDRVEGLEAGGDDYLVKPFAFTELAARVNALGRRRPLALAPERLEVGDLVIDPMQRTVTRAGKRLDLQPQEYKLLEYLVRHAGQIVTRTMLLENVWSFHFDPKTNIVESHISRLRAKVDRDFASPLIETVRGAGYRIDAPR